MTPKSKLVQASISAAVAIASIVTVPSALAESVILSCIVDNSSQTHTFRINFDTKLVEELGPSGQAYTNRIAPNAQISDNAIVWAADLMDTGLQIPVPMHWSGTIDRLSGRGFEWWSREGLSMGAQENFTCSAVTKPKF